MMPIRRARARYEALTMLVPAVCTGLAALLTVSAPASAQQDPDTAYLAVGRIIGRLTDAGTERPIEGASVRLSDSEQFVHVTGSSGGFAFVGVPRGVHQIVIEHIGYGRGTYLIYVPPGETVTFEARLETDAIQLDSLVITARARTTELARVGFHRRARRGFGHFFTADEVSSWRIREALYSVPRVEFVQIGRGASRRVLFRTSRGPCVPEIYVDGARQAWAEGDIEQVVMGRDIVAMEVYRGMNTPADFTHNIGFALCGSILIWTRR